MRVSAAAAALGPRARPLAAARVSRRATSQSRRPAVRGRARCRRGGCGGCRSGGGPARRGATRRGRGGGGRRSRQRRAPHTPGAARAIVQRLAHRHLARACRGHAVAAAAASSRLAAQAAPRHRRRRRARALRRRARAATHPTRWVGDGAPIGRQGRAVTASALLVCALAQPRAEHPWRARRIRHLRDDCPALPWSSTGAHARRPAASRMRARPPEFCSSEDEDDRRSSNADPRPSTPSSSGCRGQWKRTGLNAAGRRLRSDARRHRSRSSRASASSRGSCASVDSTAARPRRQPRGGVGSCISDGRGPAASSSIAPTGRTNEALAAPRRRRAPQFAMKRSSAALRLARARRHRARRATAMQAAISVSLIAKRWRRITAVWRASKLKGTVRTVRATRSRAWQAFVRGLRDSVVDVKRLILLYAPPRTPRRPARAARTSP